MQLYKDPFPTLRPRATAVALGTFDGLHGGHRAVIGAAIEEAAERGGISAVWCFSEPPKNVLAPGSAEPLMEKNYKAYSIARLGADVIVMPEPTAELLSMDAKAFADQIALSLSPDTVFCGFNFSFGKEAAGTPELLRKYLSEYGIDVKIIPPVTDGSGEVLSSTLLRRRRDAKK